MNPAKVNRQHLAQLTDLPNIGKSIAADLELLGITQPAQLTGMCPYEMYQRLCQLTKTVHDPCLLDTFISITRFMNGEAPQPWWCYTSERKQRLLTQPISTKGQLS
ncbi:MAG: helix-hairpin-helix domain-containing protein [Desulforhopalus sp.]|nr:helix-hairpin-helix domain-containing protein [Desulforhopalus sp.]